MLDDVDEWVPKPNMAEAIRARLEVLRAEFLREEMELHERFLHQLGDEISL